VFDQSSAIPVRFEKAIHAVIDRTRELNKITLAVIYGQLPWASGSDLPNDAEVQLALILDDDVTDFVATKLELTKTAYDVLVETGVEVAPFPVPVTHWYLPSKAANPRLIEDIRKHGLRVNMDSITTRRAIPQIEARSIAEITRILADVHKDLTTRYEIQGLYFVPQHEGLRADLEGYGAVDDAVDNVLEKGPIDVLIDFGGRPSSERILGVQHAVETALQMQIQLLTTSSIRKSLLDQLLKKAMNISSCS